MSYTYEQALEDARFFEKNVNKCTEFDDAWLFQNSRKKYGAYNPIVITKDGESMPAEIYRRGKFIKSFELQRGRSFFPSHSVHT